MGDAGVVNLDGPQAVGEVHDLLYATERQTGQHTNADAPAVGVGQGGVPGIAETIHEVTERLRLAHLLHS